MTKTSFHLTLNYKRSYYRRIKVINKLIERGHIQLAQKLICNKSSRNMSQSEIDRLIPLILEVSR